MVKPEVIFLALAQPSVLTHPILLINKNSQLLVVTKYLDNPFFKLLVATKYLDKTLSCQNIRFGWQLSKVIYITNR